MNDPKVKQQVVDKLKDATTVLVALSSSPTVDELSAALGITLTINKLGKHATAIFSGAIPPAIEFLEPEKTFENNVNSLRDFIIALDKEKADHLRYKVIDDMVKIFITPYRTTISDQDLEFSQGDYNVDFVLAIGVRSKEDLDTALAAHGKILDEATVASISVDQDSALGSINWNDKNASSYCEMVAGLTEALKTDKDFLDEQIATAYLTGIVSATERFSNEKTSSRVMTTAATLMGAGANQQLIATQLQQSEDIPADTAPSETHLEEGAVAKIDATPAEAPAPEDKGSLSISHEKKGDIDAVAAQTAAEQQAAAAKVAEEQLSEHLEATSSQTPGVDFEATPLRGAVSIDRWKDGNEPTLGGTLNATTEEAAEAKEHEAQSDQNRTILSHDSGHYLTEEPSFHSPLSATSDASMDEPTVPSIYEANPTAMAPAVDAGLDPPPVAPPVIMPPAPVLPPVMPVAPSGPTLAEIDAQNRGQDPSSGLPPLPPMPDFSTLPPLPSDPTAPAPSMIIPSPQIGATLPPGPPADAGKADPAQFHIPTPS